VELKARELFPTGILIGGRGEKEQNETIEHIKKKTPTLFQSVFQKGGFFAALDLLKYDAESDSEMSTVKNKKIPEII